MIPDVTVEKQKGSRVVITGELPAEALEKHRADAVGSLGKHIKMKGFREGKVPEKVLTEQIGEAGLLQEMAQRALAEAYPAIVEREKIQAIGRPQVTITKLAPGNPLGFSIETAVLPEITLPQYVALAKGVFEKEPVVDEVTDEETRGVIDQILQSRAQTPPPDTLEAGQATDTKMAKKPELTDDLVKTLGDFKDVADFKAKIKESLSAEKTLRAKEKQRMDALEAIVTKTAMELPEIFVEAELDKMTAQFKSEIERLGKTPEDYFKQIDKSEEDMRGEWRSDAEKRARTQLVLNEIARQENLMADEQDVAHETKHLLEHHKDANEDAVRIYVTTLLTNEKVFRFLEGQAEQAEQA